MSTRELRGRLAGLHEAMPDWIDAFLRARGRSWQQLERGQLWGPAFFKNLAELQQYLILSDPVRFGECVFVELQAPGQPPWRLWEYQKVSARYRGNTLHQCGAEVGKTREIVLLHLWEAISKRGDSLIGAAYDGHLELIYREIIGQAGVNPWLKARIDWDRTHVKPYRDLVFTNGNTIFFRPAGNDGSAFRGVHVSSRISLDEAPKVKSSETLGNFTSRATPGAEVRIYGTPDGDRDCPFYKLCASTAEVDPFHPPPPRAADEADDGEDVVYVKFRWAKTLQPAPYWSPSRERQYLVDYSGRDSSEFQQNVLGHWGDPASTVFPWQRLAACLRYLPEYVVVKLLHDDGDRQIYAEASRLSASYEIRSALGDEAGAVPSEPLTRFFSDAVPVGSLTSGSRTDLVDLWEAYLRPLVGHLSGRGLVAGCDYGSSDDPTELFFGEPVDDRMRIVARVQLKRFDYALQEAILRSLQRILTPRFGWGGDSTGVGSAIEHYLQRPLVTAGGAWEELEYTGIVFNSTTVDRDADTGEPLTDPEDPDKPRKVTWKELGTRLLEIAVQRQQWELPYDPDLMLQWSSHTARIQPSGRRRYANTNDHTIDAARCLALRRYLLRIGELGTPPMEFALPPGSRRASASLMEDF